jgi:hypothetical protein
VFSILVVTFLRDKKSGTMMSQTKIRKGMLRWILAALILLCLLSRLWNEERTALVSYYTTPFSIPMQANASEMTGLHLPETAIKSLHLKNDPSSFNLTVALCHKSLFGDIDLRMVLDWVAYHRLLGFDRIFMSYIPGLEDKDGFRELASLPYVTLFENTAGEIIIANGVRPGYQRLGGSVRQMDLEARCLDQDAKDFDWVLLSDADEYLWFAKPMGVKDFLEEYEAKGYDYISFGKSMYTMKHRIENLEDDNKEGLLLEQQRSGFTLRAYPFTAGAFCTMWKKRGLICARKNGRAKVMVKPSVHHGSVEVHGTHVPTKRKESIHIYANQAHLKEWNAATVQEIEATTRPAKNFDAHTAEEIDIYGFKLYPKNENGSITMEYDDKLREWFDYVASRGTM